MYQFIQAIKVSIYLFKSVCYVVIKSEIVKSAYPAT